MKLVVQRVTDASVSVGGESVGEIGLGLMVLVGVTHDDTSEDVAYLAEKLVNLRIFEDDGEKMNLSLLDVGGSVLSVSQFTLYGETKKGRRPNFTKAAKPDMALQLYEEWNSLLREKGVTVETGRFGEMMDVKLTNSGPVTLIMDSKA
ncbi:D-aminoacyl-tRNA deacylase [Bacillus swezeyi]|uniref:D-aminoacyl-tRNA deacylase n=1 Tax=Bacillus swezeyi TaxID=1925020 RepID=A0A1R1Q8G5_9BACI|nr:D-aminoacyl-tRNA deacylase [Bacillus swezeyi]MEC1261396.1 D-aminoacyl-tRNA deacylase [Bacillus swezeyi]MED1739956.1 D-aminoacyl-tRNA deacylase [Bacillus swezeyi]MED2929131.1 D-aminoacyl-tRNA deacylase [Bacillus swezeyi]MED2940932.1 D-aminoacyl-tRNA deacylase [Bacillus swezeyi]MED2963840.1 D-aminoacyl-tRNA deacylase [Bacillus swezeyi]